MGGKLKAGYTIHGYRDRTIVYSIKYRSTHNVAKTVIGSSLTPHAVLLVLPSGTVHPVVDCHGLPVKADLAICSPVIGVSG